MDVIGNNIANVNTIGFKQGRAVFQDLLSQTLAGGKAPTDSRGGINPRQVGTGAYLVAVDNIMSQGVIKSTDSTTDLAIEGNGYFILRGESTSKFYSRAGDFNFDKTGVLTNPSGYRVQGWMADPVTGDIQYNTSASDIVLTDAHKIMQAHATTKINYSGILDSGSTGSVLNFKTMLTQAAGGMDIMNVFPKSGIQSSLGLSPSELITVKASATDLTTFDQIYTQGGDSLGLTPNRSTVVVELSNGNRYVLNYTNMDSPANYQFTTLGGFRDALQQVISDYPNDFASGTAGLPTVTIEQGQLYIKGNTDGTSSTGFTINSVSCQDSSSFTTMLSGLTGTYTAASQDKHTSEFFFQKNVRYNEHFKTIGDLSNQIENAILGNVLNNFDTTFMENNFGLQNGEGLTLEFLLDSDTTGGAAAASVQFTFIYDDVGGSMTPNSFHTLADLANQITTALNTQLGSSQLSTVVDGEGLDFRFNDNALGSVALQNVITTTATKASTLAAVETTLGNFVTAGDTDTGASPYLEGTFNQINNIQIDKNYRNMHITEISGKGRISYSNRSDIVNNFGMANGETITLNYTRTVGGTTLPPATLTLTYVSGTPGAGQFNDLASLVTRLSTIPDINVIASSGGLYLEYNGASGDNIVFTSITSSAANQYLRTKLDAINGSQFDNADKKFIGEVAGTSGRELTDFSVQKASSGGSFDENILSQQNSVITAGHSTSSQKFLTLATEDTMLLNLFTNIGEACGFVEGSSIINFNATIGGEALTQSNAFSVAVNSTVGNMMTALEEYLGLGNSFNQMKNVVLQNGVMTVYGENGEANNIDALKLSAYPDSKMSAFNNNIGLPEVSSVTASGGRFVSDMVIYDQQGNEHLVKFDYSAYNHERNEWRLRISSSEINTKVEFDGATTNEIIIRFNPDGTPSHFYDPFTTPITLLPNPTISFDPGNGTNRLSNIQLFLGTPGKNDGLTLSRANTSINTQEQDGYPLGALDQKFFNEQGEIIGYYTNGQVRNIGQIALATFQNERGLLKVGNTMFQETSNSGSAAVGTPLSGFRGQIASNSLEQSNVDLSTEFVSMIVTQRGFQANSRVVTTSDEMIQELLNLKR
jgi:flagellar hook-basal body protein